jgi:hypothetical protein
MRTALAIALAGVTGCATVGAPDRPADLAPPAAEAHPAEAPGADAGEAAPVPAGMAPAPVPRAGAEAEGPPEPEAPDPHARERARIARAAARRVGRPFRGDCSAFVLRAYRDAGVAVAPAGPYRSRTEALFHASRPVRAPRPGDLAFFHDTYDRNRDRRLGDRFTHVAVVESVDGTEVVLVHRGRRGVERSRMDVTRPDDPRANDRLRVRRPGDAPGTPYLSGELFTAFGELLGTEFTRMLHTARVADTRAPHDPPR